MIESGNAVTRVAIVADDYIGMRPSMHVSEGDTVKLGTLLFSDKKIRGVNFASPGAGKVAAINRGAKRRFESIVIDLDGDDAEEFKSFDDLSALTREDVVENLVASGMWTALRTRPFSKIPAIDTAPHSLFITAMDTNPLAPDPEIIIADQKPAFVDGLHVVRHLTEGSVFLCKAARTIVPGDELDFITGEEFDGPHPAGLPGTHIHFLDPVSAKKTVWFINYQDVIAIGRLFRTGKLSVDRVISIAGPTAKNPRLIRTRLGADIGQLIDGELEGDGNRVVSGSLLNGRKYVEGPEGFLGRYHLQLSVLAEGGERELLGWQAPGFNKFSIKRAYASAMNKTKLFNMTTDTGGSKRAMVPIGMYEHVMPLDVLPTFLLRSLIVGDTEQAQALGALELDEDDMGLCTFVCPGKYDYGPILRKNLAQIEHEG